MKLTEEEMKLENYKMMSAISGKPLNDFIGHNEKSNYNEKDCMIKLMYLKNMLNPISSNELFNVLKSQGYDKNNSTFRVMLNQYQKYNYVRKVNNKKPFLYQITDLGNQHIKNPYLAREEGIKRYREFQLNKLKQIIEEQPELFKSIYESIFGTQNSIINNVVNSGSPYSGARIEELKDELESKIFSNDFWKNSDNDKLKTLVDGILDPCLSEEEKQEILLDAFNEAINSNKGSMILQKQYNPSKPVGMRNYYEILVKCINQVVSKSTYEAIPFRFIYIPNKRELRLESEAIAGKYRNNQDGTVLGFDYLNEYFFGGRMYITTGRQGDEIVFYYTKMNGNVIAKQYQITTMSLTDYEKAKNVKQPTLKIKVSD